MANISAPRDNNRATVIAGTSSADGITPILPWVDPITHRLLVDSTGGGGSGTVTSISSPNSTLSIASPTTTPTIDLNLGHANIWTAVQTFSSSAQTNVTNLESILFADQFTGAGNNDMGDKINTAYAALPTNGGRIFVPAGTYSFSTPIVFGTANKFITLEGAGGASTYLKFTPSSGTAITINDGNPTGHLTHEICRLTLMGSSALIVAGATNTNTSKGIVFGGANGAVGVNTHDLNVNGFGINLNITANAYMLQFNNVASSGGNGGTNGNLLLINAASNSGERNVFKGCSFTDPGNSTALAAVYITSAGTASNSFSATSFDDAQVFIGASNGQTTFSDACHFENAAFATYPQYIPILGFSSDLSTMISMFGTEFANDGTNSGNTFQTLVQHGGQLVAIGTMINNYGGATITSFVDHSLDNGLSADLIGMTSVQGGGLTNLIAGSGGVAWSHEVGAAFTQNVDNSYSIGIRAQSNNTNIIYSGSQTVATFDHAANWVLGTSGSTYALTGLSTNGLVQTSGGTGALGVTTAPVLTNTTYTNNAITASANAATVPITSRISTVTNNSAATLTITITTASAVDGQLLIVRVLDFSAVAQTITWVNTENSTVTAPVLSNGSTTLFVTVGFIYNAGTSKWRCIASA